MNRKIFIGCIFGVAIVGLITGCVFLVIRPIVVIRFHEQPKEIGVTFYKSPLLDDKKVQITLDPFRPFNVYRHSFFSYEVLIKKGNINKDETGCVLRFVNGASGRTYATYKIPKVVESQFTAEQATQAAQQIKEAAKEQYPYFELFPYVTKNMRVKYEEPYTLTFYLTDFRPEIQKQSLSEIDEYLKKFNVSIQTLKDKGVQTKFTVLPDSDRQLLFDE